MVNIVKEIFEEMHKVFSPDKEQCQFQRKYRVSQHGPVIGTQDDVEKNNAHRNGGQDKERQGTKVSEYEHQSANEFGHFKERPEKTAFGQSIHETLSLGGVVHLEDPKKIVDTRDAKNNAENNPRDLGDVLLDKTLGHTFIIESCAGTADDSKKF